MTIPETLVDAEKRIMNAARKFIIVSVWVGVALFGCSREETSGDEASARALTSADA